MTSRGAGTAVGVAILGWALPSPSWPHSELPQAYSALRLNANDASEYAAMRSMWSNGGMVTGAVVGVEAGTPSCPSAPQPWLRTDPSRPSMSTWSKPQAICHYSQHCIMDLYALRT